MVKECECPQGNSNPGKFFHYILSQSCSGYTFYGIVFKYFIFIIWNKQIFLAVYKKTVY